jgi:hypothetical protein
MATAQAADSTDEKRARGASASLRDYVTGPRLAVAAAGAVAATLMLVSLGARPLWFDELVSVEAARLPFTSLARYVSSTETNMGLYHVLLHAWLGLGSSDVLARSLSVVFGLATLPVVYALARRLFDVRVGLVSVALLSVNVSYVAYAREARGYSLVLLLATASSYFLVAAVQDDKPAQWALYGISSALAIYAHFFAGLVVVAQLASLLAIRRVVPWRRVLASVAGIVALVAPAAVAVAVNRQGGQIDWLPRPGLQQLPGLLDWFTQSATVDLLFVAAAILALSAMVADRRAHGASFELWRYALLLAWLVVPAALAFVVSFATPVYLYRYFLPSLPALIVLVAAGLTRLGRVWLLAPALLVVVGFSTRTVVACTPGCELRNDDWRSAAAYVEAHARPGDAVFFDPGELKTPFAHYLGDDPVRLRLVYPSRWRLVGGRAVGATSVRGGLAGAAGYRRVWLVTWWLPQGDVPAALGRNRVVTTAREFTGNVRIRLYERTSS